MQATLDTRERAQGAVDDLAGQVDDLMKGAEKNISRSRRSVRDAVGERLPATQDDVKAIRSELRRIAKRLDAIEERLPAKAKAKPKAKPRAVAKKAGAKPRPRRK